MASPERSKGRKAPSQSVEHSLWNAGGVLLLLLLPAACCMLLLLLLLQLFVLPRRLHCQPAVELPEEIS